MPTTVWHSDWLPFPIELEQEAEEAPENEPQERGARTRGRAAAPAVPWGCELTGALAWASEGSLS